MFFSFLPPCCCWPTTQLEPSVDSLLLSSFGFGHLKDAVDPSKVGNGGYTYTGAWMAWPHWGNGRKTKTLCAVYLPRPSEQTINQTGWPSPKVRIGRSFPGLAFFPPPHCFAARRILPPTETKGSKTNNSMSRRLQVSWRSQNRKRLDHLKSQSNKTIIKAAR